MRSCGGGLAVAAALAFASAAHAETSYVRAGRLIDVVRGEAQANRLIRIVDGKIAAVGPWTGRQRTGR